MSQEYQGRPKQQLEVTVIFGIAATRAYADGERSPDVLNTVGRTETFKFNSLEELNAFIQGLEAAVGYQDVHVIED